MIQEHQIRSLKPPPNRSLSAFKHFFARKDGNILLGDDENLFGDLEHPTDLVSLNTSEDDRLNRFLRYTCGYCFRVSRFHSPNSIKYHVGLYPKTGQKTQTIPRSRHFLLLRQSNSLNRLHHSHDSQRHSLGGSDALSITCLRSGLGIEIGHGGFVYFSVRDYRRSFDKCEESRAVWVDGCVCGGVGGVC